MTTSLESHRQDPILAESIPRPASGKPGEVAAVEAEGDVVRDAGAGDLAEVAGVEDEQARSARARVEHDRQQHAVVFALAARGRDEDRLTGVGAGLRPDSRPAALHVG